MKRSHVQDLWQRDDGSTVAVGFCARGKSLKGLANWQPFYWFVDSNIWLELFYYSEHRLLDGL